MAVAGGPSAPVDVGPCHAEHAARRREWLKHCGSTVSGRHRTGSGLLSKNSWKRSHGAVIPAPAPVSTRPEPGSVIATRDGQSRPRRVGRSTMSLLRSPSGPAAAHPRRSRRRTLRGRPGSCCHRGVRRRCVHRRRRAATGGGTGGRGAPVLNPSVRAERHGLRPQHADQPDPGRRGRDLRQAGRQRDGPAAVLDVVQAGQLRHRCGAADPQGRLLHRDRRPRPESDRCHHQRSRRRLQPLPAPVPARRPATRIALR